MSHRIVFIFTVMLMTACATQNPDIHSDDLHFISKIQQGGYVIFLTHAATDPSNKDTDTQHPANCEAQRRLSGLGKTQAKVIGKSINKLKIPIGEVFSSYYCRCTNTAKLAFGRFVPLEDISSIEGVSEKIKTQRIQALRGLLVKSPEEGTNTVIVGHDMMLRDLIDVSLEEGEAAIFKPDGSDTTRLVTQVKPNGWQTVGMYYSQEADASVKPTHKKRR